MPNQSVPAAAERVSKIQSNTLSATISRYKADWIEFLTNDSAQCGDAPPSYKSSMMALEQWSEPAESRQEAVLALRLALDDYEMGDTPRIPAMLKAALGWMDEEGATSSEPPARQSDAPENVVQIVDQKQQRA